MEEKDFGRYYAKPVPQKSQEQLAEEEQIKKRIIALARELSENKELFPFPGIDRESYEKLKEDEKEFSGFTTPIDELIKRFEKEGMKVVFGNDPESGNVFILLFSSEDVVRDSVLPKHLQIIEGMNEKLKELIELDRQLRNSLGKN